MRSCGIVTEYNPFHNGHRYHIEQARRVSGCDALLAVMSGNFVQRGECAIVDKWTRAKAAIQAGCDLVIELPYPYVVQRSDIFARQAVALLQLASIDTLVFGSETTDMQQLHRLADTSYEHYQKQRKNGISMAKTLEMVHGRVASNDILGIAYLRALKDSAIQPIAIQRTNGYHDEDILHAISSATAIRRAVKEKKPISHTTPMAEDLQEGVFMEDYYPYLQTLLLSTPAEELKKRFLVDEGMEHMLQGNARKHMDYGSFLQACITQRYPRSSIQRSLTHILTHTDKQEIDSLPPCTFLRILAFNDTGRACLRELKQKEIAIASAFHQIPKEHREIFLRTTAAYACAFPLSKRKEVMDSELRSPMYITS